MKTFGTEGDFYIVGMSQTNRVSFFKRGSKSQHMQDVFSGELN